MRIVVEVRSLLRVLAEMEFHVMIARDKLLQVVAISPKTHDVIAALGAPASSLASLSYLLGVAAPHTHSNLKPKQVNPKLRPLAFGQFELDAIFRRNPQE